MWLHAFTWKPDSDNVMYTTPSIDPARFKMSNDTSFIARRETTALWFGILGIRPLPHVRILKEWASFNHISHLPGVIIPVGRKTPHSPIAEHSGNLEREVITDESALAVARFPPRVREKGPDLVKAGIAQHDRERLCYIGLEHSNVTDARIHCLGNQLGNPRHPHLERKVITIGVGRCRGYDLLARPRTNLKGQRRPPAKEFLGVQMEIVGNSRVANASSRFNDIAVGVRFPRAHKVDGEFTAPACKGLRPAHENGPLWDVSRSAATACISASRLSDISSLCCCPARGLVTLCHGHFFPVGTSEVKAAMKASCGTSTRPMDFMRFLPSFCFSSSLRLRLMSPP